VSGTNVDLGQVAAALALVAVAIGISMWERARLEGDIALAALRAFVQLTAIGFVINAIFESDQLVFVFLLVGVMVVVGAFTARHRARAVPGAFWPLLIALALAGSATLGLIVALGVFEPKPRFLVPVGGMVIGNAMTSAAVALSRLEDEVGRSAAEIEARLSLGATARQSIDPALRRSLTAGMINVVDSTKTAGLVFIPGTTVGMLLGGAEPLDAIRLQLILFYLLVGGVAIAVVLAATLAYRGFFTPAHQLRDLETA
jgi:putative ABC transport system permease protein